MHRYIDSLELKKFPASCKFFTTSIYPPIKDRMSRRNLNNINKILILV